MKRMRQRARARTQVEAGGGTVLQSPELLARHADGTLWGWTHGKGWTKIA